MSSTSHFDLIALAPFTCITATIYWALLAPPVPQGDDVTKSQQVMWAMPMIFSIFGSIILFIWQANKADAKDIDSLLRQRNTLALCCSSITTWLSYYDIKLVQCLWSHLEPYPISSAEDWFRLGVFLPVS